MQALLPHGIRAMFSTLLVLLFLAVTSVSAKGGARQYLTKSDQWFAGDEAKTIAANILSYQAASAAGRRTLTPRQRPIAACRKT